MTAYESVFIIRPDLDDEAVGSTCDRIAGVITANEGVVIALEKVGHRRLSYEVKGFNDGFYVVLNYEGQAAATNELERFFKISDNIIRYLIVKREVPYKKPERAVKKKTEDEEAAAAPAPGIPAAEPAAAGAGEVAPETAPEAAAADVPAEAGADTDAPAGETKPE